MSDSVEFLARGVLIGVGGAALMDAWALFSRRAFGIQGLDYAMLGRWIGHFPRRRVPDLAKQIHPFLAILPAIAEVWMVLYLLVKGVRSSSAADRAPSTVLRQAAVAP